DLEGEGEALVTGRLACMEDAFGLELPRRLTLLKAAHHGSKNSTKEAFLKIVNPRMALISAGRDNSYGHPHQETMERLENRGCRIYQTPESGAVTVRVKGGIVRVEEYTER
ncbi:MAG: DNA internalization-related competence protein ComEC/Rec2, partial [Lachnospiraceae bacterium]|nr:DNA internalization-related competence protein ComEC/Rec2 [Lachnospiraceae bacterium]